MNLSFRQLQAFVEVMRAGSVSEAGRSLGRTQPAISAMISNLEKEIGFPLFERERKRLVPKPEAYYFLEEAEFLLNHLTRSARTLQDIGNLEKGYLRIACNPAASNSFMPNILASFLRNKPKIQTSLMTRSSTIIADWIASQKYDVGIGETQPPRQTVRSENFAMPCVCAVHKDDPLSVKDIITPTDLNGQPMAVLFDQHQLRTDIVAAFQTYHADLFKRFEVRTLFPALQMVSQGLCCLVCDSLTAHSYEKTYEGRCDIVFRPFRPKLYLSMSLMTPANRPLSMLTQELTVELRKQLRVLVDYLGST